MATVGELISQCTNQGQMSNYFTDKLGILSILSYSNNSTIYNGITSAYEALSDAIADVPSNGGIIFFPSTENGSVYNIDSNITIPSNVTLWFAQGAKFKRTNDAIITLNCGIHAGLYQIFDDDGTGSIVGSPIISNIYPEWFGLRVSTTIDSSLAFQKCINFVKQAYTLGRSYTVILNGGVYKFDNQITLNYYTRIKLFGLVKILCTDLRTNVLESKSNIYFEHTESLDSGSLYGSGGFHQSKLIDGSNGGIILYGANKNVYRIANRLGDNGNFTTDSNSDGLADGWSAYSTLATKSIANNVQTFKASATSGGIQYAGLTNSVGNIIYVCAMINAPSTSISMNLMSGGSTKASVTHSSIAGREFMSVIHTAITGETSLIPVIRDNRSSAWTDITVDNVYFYNLTSIFGAGHEPTKAQMDAFINTFIQYTKEYCTGQIGIEYGNLDTNGLTVALLKNSITHVEMERFGICFKLNNWHNYLLFFSELGFRNSAIALQTGDETHRTLTDSGENIRFEKCTFGGCGSAWKRFSPIDITFLNCSFDMNNCVFENFSDGAQFVAIEYDNCWIERNGLTSIVNYGGTLGLFINHILTNQLKIDIDDILLNYGGITEGVQLTDYLIRGNILLTLKNLRTSIGTDFYAATKIRLFLCSNDVVVVDRHEFKCNSLCVSEYYGDMDKTMFEDLPLGAIPLSGAFGDYTLVTRSGFNVANVINTSPFNTGGQVIQLQPSPAEGTLEFIQTNFTPINGGKTIRPLLIWEETGVTNGGCSIKVYLYDRLQNQIGTYLNIGYVGRNDFAINPLFESEGLIPKEACYYKLKVSAYFNDKVGEILIKYINAFTY